MNQFLLRAHFVLILGIIFTRAETSLAATTLQTAYQSALVRSETIASQERLILIAEEHYSQAKGSILPNLYLNGSYTVQDKPADPLAASFFPQFQPELKLTLRQPIFQGLREFAALKQSQNLINSEQYSRENAVRLLFNDVAKCYHAVLAAEENLHNINQQLKTHEERINDLNHRVREGTSRQTDLLALLSSRATIKAQLRSAQASVASARETFSFLTDLPLNTELVPITGSQPRPKPLEEYLQGIERRPDVLLLIERVQASDSQIRIAKGAHAPAINLLGNYYFKRQSDVYRGIDWDVQMALSFPLFAGGTITSQVKESALQRERADFDLTRLRRSSEQQIRTLYSDYLAGLESITALEESLTLAEKNYQLLKSDFHRGLTRNLEVLQSLISTYEIRRELLRARFVERDRWVELNTAAGYPPFKKGT